nr:hypothetical protein [Tanacetum cinerariifolium]
MKQPNPTFAKIPILDTRKFEQWKFRIQQYLQNEHYALWEVIEFGDSYEAPQVVSDIGSASEGSAKKKGKTIAVTTEDMQKRRNDVKVRTTLLLALPDEHQLRFSKYKTAQELWAAILNTFGRNEATKKTKKNQLKQQYGNFKAEGKETLEQTFNRLQAIISHLEFIDVEIEQDDLNKKFLTSLAPEWFMYTIVWRNRSDLDTMSLDDLYNHLKVYEPEKKTGKKITIQGTDVAGFDKSKVKCFNCHKMGYFTRECRAPRSQDRGRRENFKQGSQVEESAPKALMAIDGVGCDWSYMANEEEDHDLVADQEAPKEFALMAKSSCDTEVFDNSLCSKACKKNTDSLNTKITKLSKKLSDTKTTLYHYKLGLSQVKARLFEFKNQEIKFCEKIRGLEFKVESKDNRIERLTKKLEELKKEKEGLDSKLTVYSPPKKDMSWTGLPEFADDTITDYSRPFLVKKEQGKTWPKNNNTHKSMSPRNVFHKTGRQPMRTDRPNMNAAQPKRTSFTKPAHSYVRRPFQRTSVEIRKKLLRPQLVGFGELNRILLTKGNSQNIIDDKGYWDSACSRHMTGNVSYLSDYEPYDGGYVSFGQGGGKITGKGVIKT